MVVGRPDYGRVLVVILNYKVREAVQKGLRISPLDEDSAFLHCQYLDVDAGDEYGLAIVKRGLDLYSLNPLLIEHVANIAQATSSPI